VVSEGEWIVSRYEACYRYGESTGQISDHRCVQSSCDHEATMHTCQTGVWMCVVLCCVVSRLQRLVNVLRHKLLTLAVQHDFEP